MSRFYRPNTPPLSLGSHEERGPALPSIFNANSLMSVISENAKLSDHLASVARADHRASIKGMTSGSGACSTVAEISFIAPRSRGASSGSKKILA